MVRGETFWDETADAVHGTPFAPGHYDVVIAGGGMSGSFAAYTFAKEGFRVCLLEAQCLGEQSSAANTGLLQYSSDMPLFEAKKEFGDEDGELFYQASFEGLERIREISATFPEEVHCIERTSLYYASNARHRKYIENEFEALLTAGYPVEYLDDDALTERYGIDRFNGLLAHEDAEINPYAFVQWLLKDALKNGLVIHEQTKVERHEDGTPVRVLTSRGEITADAFILATGYTEREAKKYLKGKVDRVRSYALVTEPIPEAWFWPEDVMIWESDRPYLYIRRAQGNRIVIGGLDENTPKLPSRRRIDLRTKQLLKQLNRLFPHIQTRAARSYGAVFGETRDGMPIIGRMPGEKHAYGLYGYGGNGTVYSSIGADLLLDLVQGKENPYEHLFQFER